MKKAAATVAFAAVLGLVGASSARAFTGESVNLQSPAHPGGSGVGDESVDPQFPAHLVARSGGSSGESVDPQFPAHAVASGPGGSGDPSVDPQSPAHLVAAGAGVSLVVQYTCPENWTYSAEIYGGVTESPDERLIAQGSFDTYNSTPPTCDGSSHTYTLTAVARGGGGASFKDGSAIVQAHVFGCTGSNYNSCFQTSTTNVIAISHVGGP